MSAFDLTPRLAREARSNGKDTILFDKALPGFGLRIHPSGRKAWIVQARIEGRSRRIVVVRHGEMTLAEARRRARDLLARIRAGGYLIPGKDGAQRTRTNKVAPCRTLSHKEATPQERRAANDGARPTRSRAGQARAGRVFGRDR